MMTLLLSQVSLPPLRSGALEEWVIAGAAAASLVLIARKALGVEAAAPGLAALRQRVERDLESLRDRLDARFLGLHDRLDQLRSEVLAASERRETAHQQRFAELEKIVARLDERTRV
jgi:alkanesulfonate monooxygenase SsuD/methylene tetrahydromethanopterin reductase-like flavin-dependent oxidoreductase (luciferase family)